MNRMWATLWDGLWCLFDWSNSPAREAFDRMYPPDLSPDEQDARALRSDWQAVMSELFCQSKKPEPKRPD